MNRSHVAAIVSILALTLPLALGARKSKPAEGPAAELRKAPPSAQAMQNPFVGDSEAAAAGRKLYRQHCAPCHGREARGQEKAPNLHAPAIQNSPAGSLFWILRNGRIRKGMPSWSRLPDQQLWQLVTYLETLD